MLGTSTDEPTVDDAVPDDAAPDADLSPEGDGPARPVTVAHLTTVASSLRYLLRPQLTAVRDRGGDCVGISAPGADADHLTTHEGLRHIPLRASTRSMSLLADLRAALELRRLLKHEHVDILHTHNPKPGLYGRIVGRMAGVPLVVNTNHGLYATEHSRWPSRLLLLLAEGFAARFSDVELIQNPEDVRTLTRWRLNRPSRTRLLGNGVDLDRFVPDKISSTRRTELRARWGADDDTVVVGMVGRLVREKGCRELFEAARRLGDRHPPGRYVVVVIGPTDLDKADAVTREEIHRAEEQAGVVFLGMRDDVDELYGCLDLFALPSYREGFPRAAMEAAAAGLPVIASDVRGCRQVVDHGTTGLLVPVRNGAALADAIAELGEDPDRRAGMGKAAAARAGDLFDENQVVERVLDAYREAAERKGLARIVDAFTDPRDTPAATSL